MVWKFFIKVDFKFSQNRYFYCINDDNNLFVAQFLFNRVGYRQFIFHILDLLSAMVQILSRWHQILSGKRKYCPESLKYCPLAFMRYIFHPYATNSGRNSKFLPGFFIDPTENILSAASCSLLHAICDSRRKLPGYRFRNVLRPEILRQESSASSRT